MNTNKKIFVIVAIAFMQINISYAQKCEGGYMSIPDELRTYVKSSFINKINNGSIQLENLKSTHQNCWVVYSDRAQNKLLTQRGMPNNDELDYMEPLVVKEVLGNIDTMSNGYIFGKIFLTSDSVDGEELIFSLARPINDPNGNPLIISKDIDIDTAEEIIRTSQELSFTTDKTYDLEIYKFIADVSYYDQTIKNSRVFFKLIDERLPRGYFGYTEENISKMVITSIIRNYALISELYNTQKRLTNEIISNWVGSSTWEPDFKSYWQNSGQILPSRLLSYLSSELSINI
jgi:hypothetical protein